MNNHQRMFEMAKTAARNAYAPYSKFKVGACILSTTNNLYVGCNVENISYPVGTCAEAGAISSMIASGDTKIKEILVYASSTELITPCGACRQRIAEFSEPSTLVHLANEHGIQQTTTIEELLPKSFKDF